MKINTRYTRSLKFFLTRFKSLFDFLIGKIQNEQVKVNLLKTLPFWTASFITGIVAVVYTKLFQLAEQFSNYMFTEYKWSIFFITPISFLIAWQIVVKYAPFARGSGIPQVMTTIDLADEHELHKIKKLLSLRIIIVKIISSIFMIFGGGAIGREGPTIQISGAIFSITNRMLPAWWPKISRKNMIVAGAAAGLAAAFNTPLGGVVFVMEELTKTHLSYFRTAIFTAVIIAGLTAQGLLGSYLYIGYTDFSGKTFMVFPAIILVGLIAGSGGAYAGKYIIRIMRWRLKLKYKYASWGFVIISALSIATIAFLFDERILGSGKEHMIQLLFTSEKFNEWYLPFVRIYGSVVSFVVGGAGGIFAPSLSAGSTIGSVIAGWLSLNASDANIVILAGMVAFLTGITRTPFTAAILVLEMTDRNTIIFHLLTAGIIASLIAYAIQKKSLYDHLKNTYRQEVNHIEPPHP